MSIESDGRIREFNSIDDASEEYLVSVDQINVVLESKQQLNSVWFRRKADKVTNKTRMM